MFFIRISLLMSRNCIWKRMSVDSMNAFGYIVAYN